MTQQGFLRIASNPKALSDDAVSMSVAWKMYDDFLDDMRITFADEPSHLEAFWRSKTQSESFTPKVWNDAYLAAFAETAGFDLVTFDKGFRRYPNLRCTVLS